MRRLVQILGEGVEELYYFPNYIEDQQIYDMYQEYIRSEYETFEEFLDNLYSTIGAERVFLDEIYID